MAETSTKPTGDAAICHAKGWTGGTKLVGTESGERWSTTTTIQITAIGERSVLAKTLSNVIRSTGKEDRSTGPAAEALWTLGLRDWQVVP